MAHPTHNPLPIRTSRAGSTEITVLFTCFIAATYGFGIYLFAALMPDIRAALGFDYAAVGVITASVQAGFLVFALLSGFLAPVLGARRTILGSTLLCAACLLAMPMVSSTLALGLLLTLLGAAAASVWIPMAALTQEIVPEARRGMALGLMSSGTAYGVFLNGWVVPAVLPGYGWARVCLLLGGVTLLLALWALWRMGWRDGPVAPAAQHASRPKASRLRVLLRPLSLGVLAMMFLNGLSCMPAQNYLSGLMREQLHYDVSAAALAWTLIGVLGMGGGMAMGALADRITIRWAMVLTYVLLSMAALCFRWHAGLAMVYAGAVCFGLAFYAVFGLVPAYVGALYSADDTSAVFGVGNVLLGLGGVAGNLVGGISRQNTGDFDGVFGLVLAAALATLALSFFMRNERA